jgi:2-polyprenyl-6-methoxyphenol hydroxylase-like FAD-dependent oxidoreductase
MSTDSGHRPNVPVVIIGAGPTGLAAATFLGQYGIETLVLERPSSTRWPTSPAPPA